jgi:hypothetical protein
MKNRLPPNVPLAIAILAAVAAVALRAAARRPRPHGVLRTDPPLVAAAEDNRPQPAVTAGKGRPAGQEMSKPPAAAGRPDGSVEQMQHVFHELHAEGRHPLCAVCGTGTGVGGTRY